MTTVVCTKCNWTSFAVTRKHAEDQVKEFNEYFNSLPLEQREQYYGNRPSSVNNYTCLVCNGSSFTPGNTALSGSTLNPVIYEDKEND